MTDDTGSGIKDTISAIVWVAFKAICAWIVITSVLFLLSGVVGTPYILRRQTQILFQENERNLCIYFGLQGERAELATAEPCRTVRLLEWKIDYIRAPETEEFFERIVPRTTLRDLLSLSPAERDTLMRGYFLGLTDPTEHRACRAAWYYKYGGEERLEDLFDPKGEKNPFGPLWVDTDPLWVFLKFDAGIFCVNEK